VQTEDKPNKKKNVGRQADTEKIVWRIATRPSQDGGPGFRHWTIEKESLN
jgi:hypothetical protein